MLSFRRFLPVSGLLVAAIAVLFALPLQAQNASPSLVEVGELSSVPPPQLEAKAWLTMDANSGQIITSHNPNEKIEPASLTKLMSAYLIFNALEEGQLDLDQTVHVSETAWKTVGSRMFINPGSEVTVDDLLQGMIVQSGNDATVALAEALAGSESSFAALMNQEAERQGLTNTYFENSSGLPGEDHLTSAYDLAILARNLIQDFPQHIHYYSQKEYTYNDIKQNNRNRLLWTDSTVDGLKTGHTKSAGYCLVSTALRDDRRVISIVIGADSDAARAEYSLKLLNWSFQNFDTIKLFDKDAPAVQARVWEGEADVVGLGSDQALWVTVPRGKGDDIDPVAQYTQPLIAPLTKDDLVGELQVSLDGNVLVKQDLRVMDNIPEAGFFGRLIDKARRIFD